MGPPPHRTRSLWHDRSGSVAVTTVLVGSLMFGMAALVIDVSRFYLLKRQQQTVTDLAAAAAAANIAHASAAAAANLLANGVPAANLASVDVGTYAANPAVAAGQRFTVGSAATANAARVTLRSSATAFFGRFVSAGVTAIGTRSVAVNTNTAAFALGSAVAGTDSGLANGILGGLMNATLTCRRPTMPPFRRPGSTCSASPTRSRSASAPPAPMRRWPPRRCGSPTC